MNNLLHNSAYFQIRLNRFQHSKLFKSFIWNIELKNSEPGRRRHSHRFCSQFKYIVSLCFIVFQCISIRRRSFFVRFLVNFPYSFIQWMQTSNVQILSIKFTHFENGTHKNMLSSYLNISALHIMKLATLTYWSFM